MARVFITGSSQGLGLMAGQFLVEQGHEVVLHARNAARAKDTRAELPKAEDVVVGDLSTLAGMREVANAANALGRFDGVIHNAGLGYREPRRETVDGLPQLFAVNTIAPYVLTALMSRPDRLVYLSSGMHRGADLHLDDLTWKKRPWQGAEAYAETKLQDLMLAFAIARHWPDVRANALEPGWVSTRMGGAGAPDDMDKAHRTQAWLATDPKAEVTGQYFFHMRPREVNTVARDVGLQDKLLAALQKLSGVTLP